MSVHADEVCCFVIVREEETGGRRGMSGGIEGDEVVGLPDAERAEIEWEEVRRMAARVTAM